MRKGRADGSGRWIVAGDVAPVADSECKVMLVEPRGVVNTGEADSELTAPNDEWI